MIEPAAAALLLVDTIKHERRHYWYKRTVAYADRMIKLITGEGADELLRQIVTRESEEQFNLRKKLFFPIPPAVCNRARVPFAKVPKADGVVDTISYSGEDGEAKRKRLDAALDGFYGDESLADYMNDRFLDLNRQDPNAFIMVDFTEFDHNREQAQPYPLEISSKQAINYGKVRNQVEWVIGQFDITYEVKKAVGDPVIKNGKRFVMYFGWIWDLTEVEFNKDAAKVIDTEKEGEQLVTIGRSTFLVRLIDPFSDRQQKAREFQGIQAGHVKDLFTGGDTFVSSLHGGIQRMEQTLKSGSEHSLVIALMAHPRLYQYLPKCEGDPANNVSCVGGKDPSSGHTCSVCKGTGRRINSSVLDVVTLPFESDMADKDLISLEKLQHFSAPDVAIVKFLWEYLLDTENRILTDIFTSVSTGEQASAQGEADTATKVRVDEEAQNDAVFPYAEKWATVKTKITRLCALFVDAEKGLDVVIKVPNELIRKPLTVMVQDMTAAKNTVSPTILSLMDRQVAVKMLKEKPLEIQKYDVKARFRPLEGLTPEEKKQAIADGILTQPRKILRSYENEIYHNLDRVEGFWYMNEDEQRKLIDVEVAKITAQLQAEQASTIDFGEDLREPQPAVAA